MRRRTLSITLAASLSLLAAQTAFAESLDFQSANGSSRAQSGGEQAPQSVGTNVQTVDLGDVTGTVCDCGEVSPAPPGAGLGEGEGGHGFPKFPLLALSVLPGIIPWRDSPPTSPPTPPPSVPEPATLATLVTGLAALIGLHKRRA